MKKLMLLIFLLLATWHTTSQAANIVVLDDSTFVNASLTDISISYHQVLQISNKNGKDAAHWAYTLDKSHKLRTFSATIADENGKIVKKLKKSDLLMTELSNSLADDTHTFYIGYSPINYPVTVTYDWTVESHDGEIAYPSFCPMTEYDEQINHASYTIRYAANNPCRYKALQCGQLSSDQFSIKKEEDGCIKAVFNHIPAIKQEPYSLPFRNQTPMVLFAPDYFSYLGTQGRLDTWKDFGLWQYELLKGRDELPASIKQKVHELTDALPTKQEKIARLYQYLYDNTRYVSIQLGIGGYQPISASEVATNGFGDCKGLSNFMIALLQEIGIPAIYTAISTIHTNLLEDFPNLNQLNHAIVAVPMQKDTLWLECTNARIPLGYVHEDIAGHEAILIKEDGGEIVRLPKYSANENKQDSKIKLCITEIGEIQMDGWIKKTNRQYENALPLILMDEKERQKVFFDNIYFPVAEIHKFQIEEEKGKAVTTMHIEANSNRYANVSGKRIFVKLNPLKVNYSNIQPQAQRQSPFCQNYSYCDNEDIEISLPKGYSIESMPADFEINNQFATFKVTYKKEENAIHAIYHTTINSGTFGAQCFDDFVKTRNEIASNYGKQVVLVKQ